MVLWVSQDGSAEAVDNARVPDEVAAEPFLRNERVDTALVRVFREVLSLFRATCQSLLDNNGFLPVESGTIYKILDTTMGKKPEARTSG